MNPEWLRYYIAAKLNANVEDLDFNPDDFIARVNSDLVGKYVNIASRAANFITKYFGGELQVSAATRQLLAREARSQARARSRELRGARARARPCASHGDRGPHQPGFRRASAVDSGEGPGELSRAAGCVLARVAGVQAADGVARARVAAGRPSVSRRSCSVSIGRSQWSDAEVLPTRVNPYQHLMTRVDPKQLDALFDERAKGLPRSARNGNRRRKPTSHRRRDSQHAAKRGAACERPAAATANAGLRPARHLHRRVRKVDLRVARIVNAEHVEGADKLLKLTLDLGSETRTVFAGIKSAYDPATLKGRLTVVVANLAPRKMKFGVSQGMVLAASGDAPGCSCSRRTAGADAGNEDQLRHDRAADDIDALLPQTQCTRCGYNGCKPYAQAIAGGTAQINQCPPGGAPTIAALRTLLQSRARCRSILPTASRARRWSPSSMRSAASVARSACRRAPSMRSSALASRCTRSSRRCAPDASCVSRRARWIASRWSRAAHSRILLRRPSRHAESRPLCSAQSPPEAPCPGAGRRAGGPQADREPDRRALDTGPDMHPATRRALYRRLQAANPEPDDRARAQLRPSSCWSP